MHDIYEDLMLLASGVIATLSVMVLAIKIPQSEEFEKFRKSRKIFSGAGFLLALFNLSCFFVGYVHPFDKMAILATAPYQALLMTGTALVLITPSVVRRREIYRDLLIITVLVSAMYISHLFFPTAFSIVYKILAFCFLGQIISYTSLFVKSYRSAIKITNEYYEEDYGKRMIWVNWVFLGAIFVGLWSFVCLFIGSWGYLILVPAYITTYTILAFQICRYSTGSTYLVAAIHAPEREKPQEPEPCQHERLPEKLKENIRKRLDKWVADKKFVERDIPYDEVLAEIGVDIVSMRRYMKDELGTDFRSWRNALRLEEACRMFKENPGMSVGQISAAVGYNDSSNFHKDFRKKYGMSVTVFKKLNEVEEKNPEKSNTAL